MKIYRNLFIIIALLILSSCTVHASEHGPIKILINTTSDVVHTFEIREDMNIGIGAGSLEIESHDSRFRINIIDVKGFRYLLPDKPSQPSDNPNDEVTEISESSVKPSEIKFDNNYLHIFSKLPSLECRIVNVNGNTVYSNQFTDELVLNLEHFAAGTYILNLSSGETLKFMVK